MPIRSKTFGRAASRESRKRRKMPRAVTSASTVQPSGATGCRIGDQSAPQPVYTGWDPEDPHGGVEYLDDTDWSGKNVPRRRVATVGYDHSASNPKDVLDFDTIYEAVDFLRENPLRYKDGCKAYPSDPRGQFQLPTYVPAATEIIVVKGGKYVERQFTLAQWVMLLADGDVVIEPQSPHGSVIRVADIPLLGRDLQIPRVQIGNSDDRELDVEGRIRVQPFEYQPADPDGDRLGRDQRGIDADRRAELHVYRTDFSGFRVSGSGAAISGISGSVSYCKFDDCRAMGADGKASGGAISGGVDVSDSERIGEKYKRGLRARLSHCTFTNCTAELNGGAVEQIGRVMSCSFKRCAAEHGSGGGCYNCGEVSGGETVGLPGGTFEECEAALDGGAIAVATIVTNVRCTDCVAGGSGGAFADIGEPELVRIELDLVMPWVNDDLPDPQVVGCYIDRNTAMGSGGGGLARVKGAIDQCSITRNSAVGSASATGRRTRGGNGGGLFKCRGRITNCIVAANHAGGDGGGLFNCRGALTHVDVLQNKADGRGGGARRCRGKIRNCIILGNWSMRSRARAKSNQLSKCSPPARCLLPNRPWARGRGNVRDRGEGPGFEVPMPEGPRPPAESEFAFHRSSDPTTLSYYAILDGYDALRLRPTADSPAVDHGKDLGVESDLVAHGSRAAGQRGNPDIGALEFGTGFVRRE